MIIIESKSMIDPYKIFFNYYENAINKKQNNIEALSISSFNSTLSEVESRYVNLKYIADEEWTFFTNYNSPKARSFSLHDQISALFFWDSINVQIRLKAKIKKSSKELSDKHFAQRSKNKNALSISSLQSQSIESYEKIIENYNIALKDKNLLESRPKSWGGFTFTPYYFEFWEGHSARLNKRDVYERKGQVWKNYILQP